MRIRIFNNERRKIALKCTCQTSCQHAPGYCIFIEMIADSTVKKPATAATIAGRVPLFPTIRLAKPVSTAMPPRMAATSVDSQSSDATVSYTHLTLPTNSLV